MISCLSLLEELTEGNLFVKLLDFVPVKHYYTPYLLQI